MEQSPCEDVRWRPGLIPHFLVKMLALGLSGIVTLDREQDLEFLEAAEVLIGEIRYES